MKKPKEFNKLFAAWMTRPISKTPEEKKYIEYMRAEIQASTDPYYLVFDPKSGSFRDNYKGVKLSEIHELLTSEQKQQINLIDYYRTAIIEIIDFDIQQNEKINYEDIWFIMLEEYTSVEWNIFVKALKYLPLNYKQRLGVNF